MRNISPQQRTGFTPPLIEKWKMFLYKHCVKATRERGESAHAVQRGITRDTSRLVWGFTVIELIVSLGVFSAIMLLVMLFSLDLADFSLYFQQDLYAKQEMQLTMSTLLTELRSVKPSANGSYPIEAATSTSFTFFADTNGDTVPERVRYFVGTSTLKKGTVKATGTPAQYPTSTEIVVTLLTGVSTGTFFYYNSAYTGSQPALTSTVDVSPIRAMKFQVTADVSTSTARPGPISASQVVTFRNLRTFQ